MKVGTFIPLLILRKLSLSFVVTSMSRPHAAAAGGGDRSSHHGHQVRQRGGGAPHPELGAAAAHQAGHQPAAQADQVLGVGGDEPREQLRHREGVPRPRRGQAAPLRAPAPSPLLPARPRPRPANSGADRHLRRSQDAGGGPVGNIPLLLVIEHLYM